MRAFFSIFFSVIAWVGAMLTVFIIVNQPSHWNDNIISAVLFFFLPCLIVALFRGYGNGNFFLYIIFWILESVFIIFFPIRIIMGIIYHKRADDDFAPVYDEQDDVNRVCLFLFYVEGYFRDVVTGRAHSEGRNYASQKRSAWGTRCIFWFLLLPLALVQTWWFWYVINAMMYPLENEWFNANPWVFVLGNILHFFLSLLVTAFRGLTAQDSYFDSKHRFKNKHTGQIIEVTSDKELELTSAGSSDGWQKISGGTTTYTTLTAIFNYLYTPLVGFGLSIGAILMVVGIWTPKIRSGLRHDEEAGYESTFTSILRNLSIFLFGVYIDKDYVDPYSKGQ